MTVDLVYETHSTTVDNERGIATGWLPGRLSPAGEENARELGARRRGDVEAVFVSDLRRAVETATIAFAGTGTPVHQDSRLREWNYGDLNGHPVAQVAATKVDRIDVPFPNGQSFRDVVEATRGFLVDLVADWDGTRVCVIAHSANRWALEHLLHHTDPKELISAPFRWRAGWSFTVPTRWPGR